MHGNKSKHKKTFARQSITKWQPLVAATRESYGLMSIGSTQLAAEGFTLPHTVSWAGLVMAALLCLAGQGWAEDTVTVARSNRLGTSRRHGTIVEYTGTALTLQLSNGRPEQIESSRVVSYETERVPDQKNGDQLFEEGRFADAVVSYRRAIKIEKRRWMRRIILAQLARCYRNLKQIVRAGDTFLLIMRSDPTTQLLDAIPLAWVSSPPPADLVERSAHWLDNADLPAAQLIGASWLMATAQRQQALTMLDKLTNAQDPRIALLAEAQRWRDRIVTATPDDVRHWQQQLGTMDESLRAGPYFLLGQALARQGQGSAAALAFLRIPILHADQYDLAAEALFAAAKQLDSKGDRSEARRVYQELVRTYPKHQLAPAAQQRLQRIGTN